MKFYRSDQLESLQVEQVFRASRFMSCLVALFFVGPVAVAVCLMWIHKGLWGLWVPIGIWGLIAMIPVRVAIATFQPANWWVRHCREGLLIKFRSYLNDHFPKEDLTMVFIPRGEIEAVGLYCEKRNVPSERNAASSLQSLVWLDIYLSHSETEELAQAIKRERTAEAPLKGISRTKHHDYPVSVHRPGVIRIAWNNIRPMAKKTMKILGKTYKICEEKPALSKNWEQMDDRELETYTADLWRSGDKFQVYRILKIRRDMAHEDARKFMDARMD